MEHPAPYDKVEAARRSRVCWTLRRTAGAASIVPDVSRTLTWGLIVLPIGVGAAAAVGACIGLLVGQGAGPRLMRGAWAGGAVGVVVFGALAARFARKAMLVPPLMSISSSPPALSGGDLNAPVMLSDIERIEYWEWWAGGPPEESDGPHPIDQVVLSLRSGEERVLVTLVAPVGGRFPSALRQLADEHRIAFKVARKREPWREMAGQTLNHAVGRK